MWKWKNLFRCFVFFLKKVFIFVFLLLLLLLFFCCYVCYFIRLRFWKSVLHNAVFGVVYMLYAYASDTKITFEMLDSPHIENQLKPERECYANKKLKTERREKKVFIVFCLHNGYVFVIRNLTFSLSSICRVFFCDKI